MCININAHTYIHISILLLVILYPDLQQHVFVYIHIIIHILLILILLAMYTHNTIKDQLLAPNVLDFNSAEQIILFFSLNENKLRMHSLPSQRN